MTRKIKRGGKVWINVYPDKPFTKKPAETRMGSGKGNPEGWVAVVKPGRVMFELAGVPSSSPARRCASPAASCPVKTKFVLREDGFTDEGATTCATSPTTRLRRAHRDRASRPLRPAHAARHRRAGEHRPPGGRKRDLARALTVAAPAGSRLQRRPHDFLKRLSMADEKTPETEAAASATRRSSRSPPRRARANLDGRHVRGGSGGGGLRPPPRPPRGAAGGPGAQGAPRRASAPRRPPARRRTQDARGAQRRAAAPRAQGQAAPHLPRAREDEGAPRPQGPADAERRRRARARPRPREGAPGHRRLRQGRQDDHRARRRHPPPPALRQKIIRTSTKLHAHDERNDAGTGDIVRVIECRPMSRTKRWRLTDVLEKAK